MPSSAASSRSPYNDIVGRSIASSRRSRMLAIRFFGGGLLALGVAAAADRFLVSLAFPNGYAAIVMLGAGLLLVSSVTFVSAGEPKAPVSRVSGGGFASYLRGGLDVFRTDARFRLFVYAQWLGGAVMMALPFYVLQVIAVQGGMSQVAFLLGAQTAGALMSNALWGWWGDHHGKQSLYQGVALMRAAPPILIMVWVSMAGMWAMPAIWGFACVFLLLGALGNGTTIAMLGFLMEISPDDRRAGLQRLLQRPGGAGGAAAHRRGRHRRGHVALRRLRRQPRRLHPAIPDHPAARPLKAGAMKIRRLIARSWTLSKVFYRLRGVRLDGRPDDQIWYFAFGANMHDSAFRQRRKMRPAEWRPGRIGGYRLRFNLEGRPIGKAAPANISADAEAEVWGVLYRISRADLLHLDSTEGVPGRRYRQLWVRRREDREGNRVEAVTYIADGKERDGNPSLRYLTLLRDGARAHDLPEPYLRYLDSVKPAE